MKDVSSLYPKMLENKSNINKTDVDKLFELRKILGNHWSFSLWGALIGDNEREYFKENKRIIK